MANSVITKLNPTGFNGEFDYQGATGSFSTDGQKNLTAIQGSKEGYGSFDANRWGGPESQWSYNLHPSSLDKSTELAAIAGDSVGAVEEELQNIND